MRGLTVAWLACTLHTNMIADAAKQVLRCFDDKTVETEVRRLANDPSIDAVIVTPHWGKEYAPEPSKQQRTFARAWAEAGATAIVGSHPHVLQPWEKLATADGREVGAVTSVAPSTTSGRGVGLGFVRREHWDPGTELSVGSGATPGRARVTAWPLA